MITEAQVREVLACLPDWCAYELPEDSSVLAKGIIGAYQNDVEDLSVRSLQGDEEAFRLLNDLVCEMQGK